MRDHGSHCTCYACTMKRHTQKQAVARLEREAHEAGELVKSTAKKFRALMCKPNKDRIDAVGGTLITDGFFKAVEKMEDAEAALKKAKAGIEA